MSPGAPVARVRAQVPAVAPGTRPGRLRRPRLSGLSAALLLWLGMLVVPRAGAQTGVPGGTGTGGAPLGPDEFRAVFLAKMVRFVTWPETALGAGDREVAIVLLGGGSFTNLLEALLRDVRVADRPVVLQSAERIEELPRCQILFVPAARSEELKRLPPERRAGLLTVGEEAGFTRLGGVFSLSLADRKLTVNVRNARAAGLEIQSRLLRIAEVER